MAGTKRTPLDRPPRPIIDAEAVRLFRRGSRLIDEGRDETIEFKKLALMLHRRLLLRPWQPNVFDLDRDAPHEHHKFCDWKYVVSLRQQLDELARPRLVSLRENDAEQSEAPR